ncbi:glycosyltransferase family 4 protein [Paenibacillus daejeonensis]|uniref:glycosyltransferase family 4 protein n=1 Tax=Paenibacillus daejeonensis TaxID=135193 RepID=UPI00037370D2|nr:glycosyltransferase family 4 protein [Paenibacillus daejeonensis]
MKLLYLYKYCILGGCTTQLANRLKFLRGKTEPHFGFMGDYGGLGAFEGYPHAVILPTVVDIRDYIAAGAFDAVITIDTYELYEALASLNPAYAGTVIHEVHTTYEEPLRHLQAGWADLPARHVLTPSYYMKELLEEMGIPDVQQVNNCLDTSLFRYEPSAEPVVNVAPDKRLILWVGKLDDHKNWRGFLQVAAKLQAGSDDLQFVLVGGHTASDTVKERLRVTLRELGLEDLIWVPSLAYEEMYRLYSQTARSGGLYVSTTSNESFGMTLLEAVACRCPVVAPSVGALPELMGDERAAGLYAAGDLGAAEATILRVLADTELRSRMADTGEAMARGRYGIEQVGRDYLSLLERFVAESTTTHKCS